VGVEDVLGKMLKEEDLDIAKNILTLLEVAKLWNLSKFKELKDKLEELPLETLKHIATERVTHWWWSAYEEAYLALIRKEQGNFVEAFFHSFRSVEGLFSEWGKQEFRSHIDIDEESDRPYLKPTILEDSKDYFAKAKYKQDGTPKDNLAALKCDIKQEHFSGLICKLDQTNLVELQCKLEEKKKSILLYGKHLYTLFGVCREEYRKDCNDLKRFWADDGISEKRNRIFHQLQGMSEKQLWEFWEVPTIQEWEVRILKFLNFIAKQGFATLKEASLMARVHKELVNEIKAIANKSNI
jgi:hypothetical protein